ncbi:MAG: helix-turn-helix transcriptional regulator [Eubacterium sp.]|nr:helix-turn-helix transcriptional regulator [Eubacterium sp.]
MKIMLDQLLDDRRISQNQMAKDTGISTSTLRNLNHNRTTRISFDVLEKICGYLNCGVQDLLCIENNVSSSVQNN